VRRNLFPARSAGNRHQSPLVSMHHFTLCLLVHMTPFLSDTAQIYLFLVTPVIEYGPLYSTMTSSKLGHICGAPIKHEDIVPGPRV
jgi:hypothetical protein